MKDSSRGALFAVVAYFLWGLLPIYWKALQRVPSIEILAHRVVWSLILLAVVVRLCGQTTTLLALLRQPDLMRLHGLAAALLTVNWLTYIHGVNTDRIVETSLGYYINPLVSVLLGVVVLGERLRRLQWLAVGLAAAGVVYLTFRLGQLPWIALVLAFSFGLYGLAKKKARTPVIPGLTIETGVLFLPALVWIVVLTFRRESALGTAPTSVQLLLVLAGVATSTPLLLFAQATQHINLSTIGLLQYIAPTCGLVLGTLVYGEPFDSTRLVGFLLIWTGLIVFSIESLREKTRVAPER